MKCCNDIYPSLDMVRWSVCQSMDIKSPDMSDYYNKEETDELLDNKLDVSAYTPTDLSDYYDKDEIDAAFDTVNDELANKLDASAYTPTDLSQYWTSAETAAVIENNEYVISKAINELKDTKQDVLVSGENIKTINNISLIGEGDIQIGTGGTIDLSNYYTKSETNDLLDDKLDASAYTPTDLSQYWTSSQTVDYVDSVITDNSDIFVVNWSSIRSQHIMTDELWNNLMHAIDNNKPIFGYIENQPNAIFDEIYPLQAFAMDVYGIKNIKLTLVTQTYSITEDITKNGSEDYTIVEDGFEFQTKLTAGSGISIDENNVISATGGSIDLSNYYTKSQVDAIFAELQAQIDALHECCSGGEPSTDVKKYVLYSGGTEYSMDCNSSSTLSREDLVFNSGTSIRASAVTDVTIGDCVTNIGSMAMQYFSAMTSVTIPSSVTSITYQAFDGCSSLPSLTIPSGVTIIPYKMCYNCWDLSTTNIPDGVTRINESAYHDCLSLLNITIPSTVKVIGNNAFRTSSWTSSDPTKYQKMQNIATGRTVTILAETPPTLGDGVFGIQTGSGDIATYPIYVPANSVNAYKTAWSQYANRIFAIS